MHSGELVSWVLSYALGAIGVLNTVEAHRRKGLGRIAVARLLSDTMNLKEGRLEYPPYAFITLDNTPSRSLFRHMGFDQIDTVCWQRYEFKEIKL